MKSVKRVVVTGGGGQIAYSLLFRIASGDLLGSDQPISLSILDLPHSAEELKGVVMELQDCGFPLLKEIRVSTEAKEAFEGAHYALLVGAKPRGKGMERKDLLGENGKIFVEQGQALNDVADKSVQVLVVGNPCNTNCLICMHNAPDIPKKQFSAMTRLDQNRATHQLAVKAHVDITDVHRVCIWGNHSATQVPDFHNAMISGQPVEKMVSARGWLENDFVELVQQRGSAVIQARGKSSAASAANAAIDAVVAMRTQTPQGQLFSAGVLSDGNPYGIAGGLIFSFPCISKGDGQWEIVPHLEWDAFLEEKIRASEKELIEERDCIKHLL